MNILITGAGSYVGTSVERWIKNHSNHRIDTLDMLKDTWRDADFSIYDVVYHVAGIAHVNAKANMEALYYKVNRDLTIEVAQKAKEAGVKQFIFMSSMIVFHESRSLKPEMITSDTLPCPNGFYGDSKLQAEKGLRELESDTFKVCILRPPMIYGPNSKGNFPRLIKLAAKTPVFPDFHNQRSMLYIDNLAEFVLQAVNRQLVGTFYPQNRELSDTVEIIRYFAKAQNHKVWFAKWLKGDDTWWKALYDKMPDKK
jgi:UDP-glucose 4-epimerase